MNNKLYRVTLRGMTGTMTGVAYGCPYVVAKSADEAIEKAQNYVNKENLGFREERELDRIELLAEETQYPSCRIQLLL